MCNFSQISLGTEAKCSSCRNVNLINPIVNTFLFHNGEEKSITHIYHCSDCGINFSATQRNRLSIGEDERFKKAKFLFEETHLVKLNSSLEEIFCFYFNQKKQIQKIKLFGHNSTHSSFLHVLNTDFVDKKPTHFISELSKDNFSILKEISKDCIPAIKAFVKEINYLEVYIPLEAIYFKE